MKALSKGVGAAASEKCLALGGGLGLIPASVRRSSTWIHAGNLAMVGALTLMAAGAARAQDAVPEAPVVSEASETLAAAEASADAVDAVEMADAGAAAAGDAESASLRDGLAEVVVTATRRNTSIQETPISISAVTSEVLTDSGVSGMQDLAVLVPTLRMEGGRDGGGRITMRGIRAPSGEATVGLYYGDVPMSGPSDTSQTSGSFTQEANMFDIERVEALRGPQGTLYGAGAMGGTIRILFNKASTTKESGQVDVMGSHITNGGNSWWVKGAYGLPLIENVAGVRVAGWKEHRAGYVDDGWVRRIPSIIENPNGQPAGSGFPQGYGPPYSVVPKGQRDFNTSDITGARVMLRVTPTDWLSWDGMAMTQSTSSIAGTWDTHMPWNATHLDGTPYNTPGVDLVPTGTKFVAYSPIYNQQEDDFNLFSSTFHASLPYVDLDLVNSYYDWNRAVSSNYSDTYSRNTNAAACRRWKAGGYGQVVWQAPPPATSVDPCTDAEMEQYTYYVENLMNPSALVKPTWVKSNITEFRISSNGDGPVQWIAGYYNEKRTDHVDSTEGQVINSTGLIDDLYTFPAYWFRYIDGDVKQKAYFGDVTYKPGLSFADGLALNVGLRRFEYSKYTFGGVMMGGYGDGAFIAPEGQPQFAGSGASDKGWLPKYNISYTFDGPYMLYATASKGYRPGGANVIAAGQLPPGTEGQFMTYKPDTVWNYEVGGKSSWFNNTLTLNGTFYQIDWEDTQTSLRTPSGGMSYVGNAGAAQIQGTEWDISYTPVRGLVLSGGFSYNWKAELTEDQTSDGVAALNTQGRKGDRLPYVPKLNASANVDYKHAIGDSILMFRINYAYTGEAKTGLRDQWWDPQTEMVGDYSTVNLRIGAENANGWSAYLFVNNVLDSDGVMASSTNVRSYTQGTDAAPANVTQYFTKNRVSTQTPREVGVQIRKSF